MNMFKYGKQLEVPVLFHRTGKSVLETCCGEYRCGRASYIIVVVARKTIVDHSAVRFKIERSSLQKPRTDNMYTHSIYFIQVFLVTNFLDETLKSIFLAPHFSPFLLVSTSPNVILLPSLQPPINSADNSHKSL